MAEHGLDGAEVGAVHEEIGGEAVAEGVGGDVLGDTGDASALFDDTLDAAGRKAAEVAGGADGGRVAGIIEEKGRELVFASVNVVGNAGGGGFTDEDGTVFLAFAAHDEFAAVEIDMVAIEID